MQPKLEIHRTHFFIITPKENAAHSDALTHPHRHVQPPIYQSDSHLVTPFVVPATIKSETTKKKNPNKKAAKPPNEKLQKITFAGVFIAASVGITRGIEGSLLDAGVRDTEHHQESRIGGGGGVRFIL